ncbi:MAG TPA: hypothetical protein VHA11_15275 [Bryobacteraceae bacterium]|nr:hypothetical protein [Bryobacteraceae bacterium]
MNRRHFLPLAVGLPAAYAWDAPAPRLSPLVQIETPEKSISESFWIAARLTNDMRQLAGAHYGKAGWLAVSDGKNGQQHSYDPRDFRYGPKCAAYLYGGDSEFALSMGKRIFQDQTDPADGRILWDLKSQTSIHLAQTVKHFSDYLVYGGQDEFVKQNWSRMTQMARWAVAHYDRDNDGLIEHGERVPDHFWSLLVGEPYNFAQVENCSNDVVVVSSMEVCEFFGLMGRYAARHGLAGADWLRSRAAQMHEAIETQAYDPAVGYYYHLRRTAEKRWLHSISEIDEESRELDVTPYYAAVVSGNSGRAAEAARYARKVLLEDRIFPMPLHYPTYCWVSPNYGSPFGGICGGAWEEAYYNCVRAWSHCRMLDAVQEAVRRRSEAHVRDRDCVEWYTHDGRPRGRDRYGISGMAHVSAIIEGLFGITPAGFGFDEVNIFPNLPVKWAGRPASIQVALPGGGFLKYAWTCDLDKRSIDVAFETDRPRKGNFRIFVPGPVTGVNWNNERIRHDSAPQAGTGVFVLFSRPFRNDRLRITFGSCESQGLPPTSCMTLL